MTTFPELSLKPYFPSSASKASQPAVSGRAAAVGGGKAARAGAVAGAGVVAGAGEVAGAGVVAGAGAQARMVVRTGAREARGMPGIVGDPGWGGQAPRARDVAAGGRTRFKGGRS